ncbi:MAG: hypothetical protein Q8L47_00640 [bacterium]|nr:hypothetical protein [bacterium]
MSLRENYTNFSVRYPLIFNIIRGLLVATGFFFGALFIFGSLFAIYIEIYGFMGEEPERRTWYLAVLALGLIVSIVIPFILARFLFPQAKKIIYILLFILILVLSFSYLGVSI